MKKALLLLSPVLFIFPYISSATLTPGDIAVVGFNCDGGSGLDKDFAIVTLVNIPNGEVFYLTDRGISAGTFNNSTTSEGTITFTVTTTIPMGTVIKFIVNSGSSPSVVANPATYGTISISGWTATIPGNSPWSGNGDQILIYQAGPTFIFGFNNSSIASAPVNGWHTGSSTNISFSNIPPGLTNGVNAIGFVAGTHVDNVIYNGTRTGNKNILLAAITNIANWITDDNVAYDVSPGGAKFTGSNPIFIYSTLPVHLTSFAGSKSASGHQLTWNVKNEENFNYYQVESSTDGRQFINIGRVNATGSEVYQFTNSTPGSARNYYRLKLVDADGKFTYSNVIVLLQNDEANNVLIYPNPAVTTVNISSRNKIMRVFVTDVTGRKVLQRVTADNTLALDVSKLTPGVYHIHIQTTNGDVVETISKSR